MRLLGTVLRVGLPGAAQELIYRLAFVVFLVATAGLGEAALATHSCTLQILKYFLLISMAIGLACEIMVRRLVGAKRFRQADALVRNGMLASGACVLIAALALSWIVRGFTQYPAIV